MNWKKKTSVFSLYIIVNFNKNSIKEPAEREQKEKKNAETSPSFSY